MFLNIILSLSGNKAENLAKISKINFLWKSVLTYLKGVYYWGYCNSMPKFNLYLLSVRYIKSKSNTEARVIG